MKNQVVVSPEELREATLTELKLAIYNELKREGLGDRPDLAKRIHAAVKDTCSQAFSGIVVQAGPTEPVLKLWEELFPNKRGSKS